MISRRGRLPSARWLGWRPGQSRASGRDQCPHCQSVLRSLSAAHFELGQHLYRAGRRDEAVPHLREAHRLQPQNWTYKRQAWSFADPAQGPTDLYEGNWLDDVLKIGAENYYPALKM